MRRTAASSEVEETLFGVLGKQGIQHHTRLVAVLAEHVALPDVLGALAAGQRPGVEGDVADQVEGVQVLVHFLHDHVERQALGRKLVDDRLLALLALPAPQEVVEAGEALLQCLAGEVAQGFGDQLAVLVEVFDALGDNGSVDAVHVHLVRAEGIRLRFRDVMDDDVLVVGQRQFGLDDILRRRDGIIVPGFVNLHRLAVKFRVGKVAGGAPEIHQSESRTCGCLREPGCRVRRSA